MDFQITIIGAGVVGLAIAAELSKRYSNICLIEKNTKFGQEISSRNSEVIHSGVYYPKNSLKSKLCIQGNKLLYQYCDVKNIPYNKCGKLIVATKKSEIEDLNIILKNALNNGVTDCRIISKKEITEREPNINAELAILFPSSGIIDSHGLMKQLETDSLINGVETAYANEVLGIQKLENGYKIEVADSEMGRFEFTSKIVINSSGLNSFNLSNTLGIKNEEYKLYYWKGEYFSVGNGKNKLVKSLIYPIPEKNITGLGVHATIDLNNGLKLGPNAIFLKDNEINYKVNKENQEKFFKSGKKFLPFLEFDDLHPDQAGIRPKLQKPNDDFRDFVIQNEEEKGYKNFINLIGIESPGLTSCLSIANYVSNILSKTYLKG
jgi:L-2-hydroxyglutarate oxidase LhgO